MPDRNQQWSWSESRYDHYRRNSYNRYPNENQIHRSYHNQNSSNYWTHDRNHSNSRSDHYRKRPFNEVRERSLSGLPGNFESKQNNKEPKRDNIINNKSDNNTNDKGNNNNDTKIKDSNNNDTKNKDSNNNDTKNKDSNNNDIKNKDSNNNDTKNKDSNNNDIKNKDCNNNGTKNKDSNNDDTKNNIKATSLTFGHVISEECLKSDDLLKDCAKLEVDGDMKDLVSVQFRIAIYRDHIKRQKMIVEETQRKLVQEQKILARYQEIYDKLIKQSKQKFDEITKDRSIPDVEVTKHIINIDDSSSETSNNDTSDTNSIEDAYKQPPVSLVSSPNKENDTTSLTSLIDISKPTEQDECLQIIKSPKKSNKSKNIISMATNDNESNTKTKVKKKKKSLKNEKPLTTSTPKAFDPSLETISICKDNEIQIFDMKVYDDYLYVAGSRGTLLQIDLENHKNRFIYHGQYDHVHSILLTKNMSKGGSWLVSGGFSKKLIFHRIENDLPADSLFMPGYIMCICETSRWLYCGCSDGLMGVYNYVENKRHNSIKVTKNNIGICSLVSFADDSNHYIFVGTEDSKVFLLNGFDYSRLMDLTPDAMKSPVIDFLILPCYRLLIFEKNNIHITKFGDRFKGTLYKHRVPVTHNHIYENNSLYFTSKYAYVGHINGNVDIYKVDGSSIRKVPIHSFIREVSPIRALIEYNNVIISGNSLGKIYFNRPKLGTNA